MKVNGVNLSETYAKSMTEDEYVKSMLDSPFFENHPKREDVFRQAWKEMSREKKEQSRKGAKKEGAE